MNLLEIPAWLVAMSISILIFIMTLMALIVSMVLMGLLVLYDFFNATPDGQLKIMHKHLEHVFEKLNDWSKN